MSKLDQIVKGAPPPGSHFPLLAPSPIITTDSPPTNPSISDPLANLPSSPPQIYLNLLILEASLRAQWLQLRTRRRQYTFFLTLLGLWVLYFGYALFLAPREDGSGVGGSVYWVVEVAEQMCFMGGIVTAVLIWFTGQWERGVRWPRRWIGTTNRGLRVFNTKLVIIKQPWWREMWSTMSFPFSWGLFSSSREGSYRFLAPSILLESQKASKIGDHHALPDIDEDSNPTGYEDDLASGGDFVKLLLLPKPFSPSFRENWDIYRSEYWEKENERRAILRKKLQERERRIAQEQGGWLWWTGFRGWKRKTAPDVEKSHAGIHRHASERDSKRTRSSSIRGTSHSRTSSRSATPTLELDEATNAGAGHARNKSSASTSSSAAEKRRSKTTTGKAGQNLKVAQGSRSTTPEVTSPLRRGDSASSIESLRPNTPGSGTEGERVRRGVGSGRGGKRKPADRGNKS